MGVIKMFSSSSYDCNKQQNVNDLLTTLATLPNPNPNNYSVIKWTEIGDYLLIKIKYLDCTNYEGNKIMVYKCKYETLMNQNSIDPHFSNNYLKLSPIARFEPTIDGWKNGLMFIEIVLNNGK